ncbi:Uncharacterised protein [Actinomyces howellii]|uniref:Uncharacterized protein n=1 Tax=Actinomyces howellii TaxID=52771 RepID=A0A3S4RBK6_9ACTO|nr:Uncharacterised protein [Actinomyces howellii]
MRKAQYAGRQPGQYLEGQVRTSIEDVFVYDGALPETAEVIVCSDRGDMRDYDASGQDVTTPGVQGSFEYSLSLESTGDRWRVSGETILSRNQCSA